MFVPSFPCSPSNITILVYNFAIASPPIFNMTVRLTQTEAKVNNVDERLGDISGFTDSIHNSLGAFIQYCVDNNYLPDLSNIALVLTLTDNTNVIYSDDNTTHKPYMAFDLTNTITKKI